MDFGKFNVSGFFTALYDFLKSLLKSSGVLKEGDEAAADNNIASLENLVNALKGFFTTD